MVGWDGMGNPHPACTGSSNCTASITFLDNNGDEFISDRRGLKMTVNLTPDAGVLKWNTLQYTYCSANQDGWNISSMSLDDSVPLGCNGMGNPYPTVRVHVLALQTARTQVQPLFLLLRNDMRQ